MYVKQTWLILRHNLLGVLAFLSAIGLKKKVTLLIFYKKSSRVQNFAKKILYIWVSQAISLFEIPESWQVWHCLIQ